MSNNFIIIQNEYYVQNYENWMDMQNDVFRDLKMYQSIARSLNVSIEFKSETIFDSETFHSGTGNISKGTRLYISVPSSHDEYFNSKSIRQIMK